MQVGTFYQTNPQTQLAVDAIVATLSHAAGGALAAWAFTPLSLGTGAAIGSLLWLAGLVADKIMSYLGLGDIERSYMCAGVISVVSTKALNSYGIVALKPVLGFVLTSFLASFAVLVVEAIIVALAISSWKSTSSVVVAN